MDTIQNSRQSLVRVSPEPGLLRARVVGMDPAEFLFPCYFLGEPDDPPPAQARNLLGLTGVINQICLAFDGRSSVSSPRGVLVVER